MDLPPLTALHYFVIAAKKQNFSQAAKELCVTESAVSRQMKQLSDYYQKSLFIKKGRNVELSASGAQLLAVVRPAFDNITQVSRALKRDSRQLTINVTTSFAIRWLLPKLFDFEQAYPQYPVQMQASSSEQSNAGKVFDVQIDYYLQPIEVLAVNQSKLLDEWLLPVCSPLYLKESGVLTLQALATKRLILNEMTGRDWALWSKMLNTAVLPIDEALKFEQDDVAIQAAVAGHGIALANLAYIQQELKLGSLVPATDQPAIVVGAHYVQINHDRKHSQSVQLFKRWLQQQVACN